MRARRLRELLTPHRPLLMGILNVTPDSFSDGGLFLGPEKAIGHAQQMVRDGADILDIGGESTRPYGAVPITAEEEWSRIEPVLAGLGPLSVPISVDTMKAEVARKALAKGASIVNDVWGLQRDDDMAPRVAASGADVIIMHNRLEADPEIDIFADMQEFFSRSLERADRAGILADRIVLDPGIGFGKTPAQSIAVIGNLDRLKTFGYPLLLGASRKRFIASVSASEPHQRLPGSLAASLFGARLGAAILSVHDVAETVQALRVEAALSQARSANA